MTHDRTIQPPSRHHWLPLLLNRWAIGTLIVAALFATHRSDDPIFVGRYSSLVFALLVGLFLTGIGGLLLARLLQKASLLSHVDSFLQYWQPRLSFRLAVTALGVGGIVGILFFFLGDHIPGYALLRAYFSVTVILLTLSLSFGGSTAKSATSWKPPLLIALLVLFVLIISTIGQYPSLARTDEAFIFSMGLNSYDTGNTQPTIYRFAFPTPNYGGAGLWTWAMGKWIGLLGAELWTGRLFFLLLCALSLPFLWMATSQLYSRSTAWFAVLIAAYGYGALNRIRYDAVAALWLSVALYCYARSLKQNRWWFHFLTGFAVGMCSDGPPVGFIFGVGFAVAYFIDYLQQIKQYHRWIWFPFWFLIAGGLSALAVYMSVRAGAAIAGSSSVASAGANFVGNSLPRLFSNYSLNMIQNYYATFLTNQPILALLAATGIVFALKRRLHSDRLLLILYIMWTLFIVLLYSYFPPFYIIHAMPVLAIFAALACTEVMPYLLGFLETPNRNLQGIGLALAIWLIAATVYGIQNARQDSRGDLVATGASIAQLLPRDSVVVAAEPYYFGMINHRGFVGGATEGFMTNFRQVSAEQGWDIIAPDAVVFSENWPTEPGRTPALLTYMQNHRFGFAGCWQTHSYGRVELWTSNAHLVSAARSTCQPVCTPDGPCR